MRKKLYILSAIALLLTVTAHAPSAAAPHTFHTSLMRVEYNRQEQLVEVSIQVFSHDLENILSRRSKKRIRLDKTPEAAKLALAYLNDAVNLKNRDGQLKTFSWVGMESQADAVWLYVETKMPEGLDGAQIRNRIFFDLLEDQVNLVHFKYDGKKADLSFKRGEDFKAIPETQPDKK
ncbi:MAG: hypothetical protein H7Y30_01680 [Pyrinomonadaceae bacterium]|nr:hypothetical protein [Pyrinomonadaceae bacterium]